MIRISPFMVLLALLPIAVEANVRDLDVSFGVSADAERIDVEVPIYNARSGKQEYLLTCRGGKDTQRTWAVPPLTCMVNEGSVETERSLLSEADVGPWHSRGQFHWSDLVGACGRYPEFGRIRHFRFRGMLLTFEARDIEESEHPSYFNLKISIRNEPKAASKVAVATGYLQPTDGCETIQRGVEPRMCRNALGSYEVCSK